VTSAPARHPFADEIRFILRAAMLLFVYTVAVGILNGLDLLEFGRKPLLAHVHFGTLGWLTMAVFAGTLAVFGEDRAPGWVRPLARLAPLAALLYGIAFLFTGGILRPVAGTFMGLVILGFAVWTLVQATRVTLSTPHLGMLAGVLTSVLGAVLGVLLGVRIAQPDSGLPQALADAHPAAMVVGFLVPAAMAFIEWVLDPDSVRRRASVAGWFQIGLPFIGGLAAVAGLLMEITPLIILSLPCEVIGVVIFLVRVLPRFGLAHWLEAGPARHAAAATPFLVVNIALLVYLISTYIDDLSQAPPRLFLALDHSIFVGVLTNAIIGLIMRAAPGRRPAWVDHFVFIAVVLGITGFVIGLIADVTPVIRVATPLLGAGILTAIGVHSLGAREPAPMR
jgi:hypothetical protein